MSISRSGDLSHDEVWAAWGMLVSTLLSDVIPAEAGIQRRYQGLCAKLELDAHILKSRTLDFSFLVIPANAGISSLQSLKA